MMSPTVLQALRQTIDAARVVTDEASRQFFARDAMHPQRLPPAAAAVEPLCVVQPQHTQEVAAVVRIARAYHTPVIPLGGGSGLMGGGATVVPGIVLDLRGLQEMSVRAADRVAEVGAGVTIQELNRAAMPYGLMCAHDPWTVAVATVGGTIATNSLGYLGGKYGAMGEQVLGLEVVLPDGEILRTRGVEKASTGPALHRLFVGAEGCFGIITRAVLRLFPRPQERLLQGWRFPDFAAGFAAVQALGMAGVRPGLLECDDAHPSPHYNPPATLFVSFEGSRRVAQAEAEEALTLCQAQQGQLLPPQQVQGFWKQRHDRGNAYAAARQSRHSWSPQRPPIDYLHVALPPSTVLTYRRQCLDILAGHGLRATQTGLWGHAGLFSAVFTGGDIPRLSVANSELLILCQELQGAMEYCHGVGTRLAPLMAREHGIGLAVLQRLKQSIDPQGIMNPGKLALQETSPTPPGMV